VNTINQWANDNTNGKINKVIESISDEMVMFLMNALYFKGLWTNPFDPQQTSPSLFYPDNGTETEVPMMRAMIYARTMEGQGFSALELPYGRQNFSMIILVPSGTVNEFLNDFNVDDWNQVTSALDSIKDPPEIQVILPKFKFSYEKILNDQLKDLGMTDAFIPYVADLSGISDDELYVSFVKQNTFVEVNEEGTEAAAVTTIGVGIVSLPPTFIADKSFVFAIREKTTGTLLFIGKVNLPE
jgi:serpin B